VGEGSSEERLQKGHRSAEAVEAWLWRSEPAQEVVIQENGNIFYRTYGSLLGKGAKVRSTILDCEKM